MTEDAAPLLHSHVTRRSMSGSDRHPARSPPDGLWVPDRSAAPPSPSQTQAARGTGAATGAAAGMGESAKGASGAAKACPGRPWGGQGAALPDRAHVADAVNPVSSRPTAGPPAPLAECEGSDVVIATHAEMSAPPGRQLASLTRLEVLPGSSELEQAAPAAATMAEAPRGTSAAAAGGVTAASSQLLPSTGLRALRSNDAGAEGPRSHYPCGGVGVAATTASASAPLVDATAAAPSPANWRGASVALFSTAAPLACVVPSPPLTVTMTNTNTVAAATAISAKASGGTAGSVLWWWSRHSASLTYVLYRLLRLCFLRRWTWWSWRDRQEVVGTDSFGSRSRSIITPRRVQEQRRRRQPLHYCAGFDDSGSSGAEEGGACDGALDRVRGLTPVGDSGSACWWDSASSAASTTVGDSSSQLARLARASAGSSAALMGRPRTRRGSRVHRDGDSDDGAFEARAIGGVAPHVSLRHRLMGLLRGGHVHRDESPTGAAAAAAAAAIATRQRATAAPPRRHAPPPLPPRSPVEVFMDALRLCLVVLCCCCCCPFTRRLLGERGRRRNAALVILRGEYEDARECLQRTWQRRRAVLIAALLSGVVLMWLVVVPLTESALARLWESEDLFVSRMQLCGLPGAVNPPTVPWAVVLQQPTLPPDLQRRPHPQTTDEGDEAHASLQEWRAAVDEYGTQRASLAQSMLGRSFRQRHPRLRFLLPGADTLSVTQVPAWTLHVVRQGCPECLEGQGYAEAMKAAALLDAGLADGAGTATSSTTTSTTTTTAPPADGAAPVGVFGTDAKKRSAPASTTLAVFATSAAPLGRIGPMLLAMASVTDDVDVRAELPRWTWLRALRSARDSVKAGPVPHPRGAHGAAGQKVAVPLAVLGIPSTDQPQRVALRAAQRATWMSYSEVARRENDFTGALLPLYIFAAVERQVLAGRPLGTAPQDSTTRTTTASTLSTTGVAPGPHTADTHAPKVHQTPQSRGVEAAYVSADSRRLSHDPTLLLPRVADVASLATWYALQEVLSSNEAGAVTQGRSSSPAPLPSAEVERLLRAVAVPRRRLRLRPNWREAAAAYELDAPCDVFTDVYETTFAPLPLLSRLLSLPVTPLATSPARYVCHASAALWREALERCDGLWVDMLTDRRPSTTKTVGGDGKWGLRVEVGMSQKLILWLEYAYTAFPDVPFIMKGDDDSYLKVPQYLSDVRYIRRGRRGRVPPPPDASSAKSRMNLADDADAVARANEECVYWGSMRRWNGELYFAAGMFFLLHRRLVQAVVEPRPEFNNDVAYLVATDYSAAAAHAYYANMMDHEDVMLGKLLTERHFLANELCPFRRHWYIWEDLPRFHDLHRGRTRNITWASVAVHRCRVADVQFLHHFFSQEHRRYAGGAASATEQELQERGAAWQRAQAANSPSTAAAAEWFSMPATWWTAPREGSVDVPPYVSTRDGVAIDHVEYEPFSDGVLVFNGWRSRVVM